MAMVATQSGTIDLPRAQDLARFDMGIDEPTSGVLEYYGAEKPLSGLFYLSPAGSHVIGLKARKATGKLQGAEKGKTVYTVMAQVPVSTVMGFNANTVAARKVPLSKSELRQLAAMLESLHEVPRPSLIDKL